MVQIELQKGVTIPFCRISILQRHDRLIFRLRTVAII